MVIKMQQVQGEFQRLHGNIKMNKAGNFHLIAPAYMEGDDKADKVQFNKPLENPQDDFLKIGSVGA